MLLPAPLAAIVVSLSAWLGGVAGDAPEPQAVQRMIVSDELIIHVPIIRRRMVPIEWVERKGPKCLPAVMIAGAALAAPSAVDFVMRDRSRVRAKLNSDCDGLDFYGGFYVEPSHGAVCARREEIRSRAGSSCQIERFRSLVPRVKR